MRLKSKTGDRHSLSRPNDLQTTDDASGRFPLWRTAAYTYVRAKTLQKSKCIPRAVRSLNPHGGFQDPL